MKIAVFLQGTALMHRSAIGCSREERVQQALRKEESVRDFASYVPVGEAVNKLHTWSKQGADLLYLSSHKQPENVTMDQDVLTTSHFPAGQIVFRFPGESYQELIARISPDILIEDDCESIGGEREMIFPHLKPDLRAGITSIVVKEFAGIDHLSDNLINLIKP